MRLKQVILLSILIVIAFITVNFSMDKRDLSGEFSSIDIRQVKIGMDLEEVQEILGKPYQINALEGLHELTCKQPKSRLIQDINSDIKIREIVNRKYAETDYCCEGNKDDLKYKGVTLVYSKRKEFSRHYPMLWVHLDSNFKVWNVFAKQYDGYLGFDDPCIYSLNIERDFEDKTLFEKNFY